MSSSLTKARLSWPSLSFEDDSKDFGTFVSVGLMLLLAWLARLSLKDERLTESIVVENVTSLSVKAAKIKL